MWTLGVVGSQHAVVGMTENEKGKVYSLDEFHPSVK